MCRDENFDGIPVVHIGVQCQWIASPVCRPVYLCAAQTLAKYSVLVGFHRHGSIVPSIGYRAEIFVVSYAGARWDR